MNKPTTSSNAAGRVIIISGPSGSGKTTLHKALLEGPGLKGKLVKSISATTRPKRPGERQGKDYLFITPAMFESRIAKGYFLEWEKVFDHYYGTPKRQVLNLLKKGKHVLMCIDVKGARRIRKEFPNAASIFIKTPTMAILQNRLRQRASDPHESLQLRLNVAREELREAKHYDRVVVNGRLDKACRDLNAVVGQALGLDGG
ncbi:MAG: guanylate kinase [Candidatus Omnitrophica bacterium]|nr:guanylate kinase [Candidatus Omnitrophota bacterium]